MTTPPRPGPQPSGVPAPEPPTRVPVLSNRAIVLAAIVLVIVGAGLVTVLLVFLGGSSNTDQHQTQLDAIKTAGTIVVGTGGAFALWLTARRQRTSEITVNQKAEDQAAVDRAFALQQAQADAALADAEARRITEQYGRAVDQLGSDKAAVRLGGLYALERLAQENPRQRATIVAVICAYLRMPYQPPGDDLDTDAEPAARADQAEFEARIQERQVRVTAQRILADHLRPGKDLNNPVVTFWPGANLDLTGATLIDFDLSHCSATVDFNEAIFIGPARFDAVTFYGTACFDQATFAGAAWFDRATFTDGARFKKATFTGPSEFNKATFTGPAAFDNATFTGVATFAGVTFIGSGQFVKATFNGAAHFNQVTFNGTAWFDNATFNDSAAFNNVTYCGPAKFNLATYNDTADFAEGWVNTEHAVFQLWPSGWTVVPASSPTRPRGTTTGTWGRSIPETPSTAIEPRDTA